MTSKESALFPCKTLEERPTVDLVNLGTLLRQRRRELVAQQPSRESSTTGHLALVPTDRHVLTDEEQAGLGVGELGDVLLLREAEVENVAGVYTGG